MEKRVKPVSDKKRKQLKDICQKATLAEKRAQKLTKKALAGVNVWKSKHGRKSVPTSSEDAADNILQSALIAEKQGERLVQRILGATGR